jgi:hypothetical protein
MINEIVLKDEWILIDFKSQKKKKNISLGFKSILMMMYCWFVQHI